MRTVIQRVSRASVKIDDQIKGKINTGLLVLLGIEEADTDDDIEWLSGKIVRLRVFPDRNGVMNLSIAEADGDILLISQFTLHGPVEQEKSRSFSPSCFPYYQNWFRTTFCF